MSRKNPEAEAPVVEGLEIVSNDAGPEVIDNTDAAEVVVVAVESDEMTITDSLVQINYR